MQALPISELLAAGTLGVAAGAGLMWWWRARRAPANETPTHEAEIDPDQAERRRKNRELRERLTAENNGLTRENEGLRDELTRLRAALKAPGAMAELTAKSAAKPTAASDAEPAVLLPSAPEDAPSSPPAASGPPEPIRYYAPAPDVPYIEHRKLSMEPLPIMPVRLLVPDGPAGTRASYGFSPEADQPRIIADGVRNLRAFFEFDLPPTERFTHIATATPGRLERVGERWEVREKAKLIIR